MKQVEIKCKGTGLIPLEKLKDFQGSLKELSTENFEKLKKSILTRGFIIPVFVWHNNLLDGHQRIFVLTKLKEEGYIIPEIPVVEIPAKTKKEAKEILLLINSRYGKITYDGLKEFIDLSEIKFDNFKLDFNLPDIDFDIYDNKFQIETKDDDDIPEEIKSISKSGDLWELGQHRLFCQDCTIKENVEKLMNNKNADIIFTDPPYSVNYQKKRKEIFKDKSYNKIENDNIGIKKISENIWKPAFKNMFLFSKDECSFYMTMPQGGDQMMMMMSENWLVKHELIWVKNNPVFSMGRLNYDYQHEPVMFGWKKRHIWYGKGKFLKSIWQINRPNKSGLHPTMKPIELIENALLNSSKNSDICIDFFMGSGSTLIACEKTGRICYGMEIDPYYCDVIVQRYKDYCINNNKEYLIKLNGKIFDK